MNLVKALIYNNEVCVTVIDSREIVNNAIKLHNTTPVASAALGRALSFTSIMGTTLKNDTDYLTVIINGGGPIGAITACATPDGNVKGYVNNPYVESFINERGKLDVKRAVGTKGKLTVIKNVGNKEPYIGSVNLVSGEIAMDFAQYYTISEQQPCAVALGVTIDKEGNCKSAGGVFIQVLPDCSNETISALESIVPKLASISADMAECNQLQILDKYFAVGNYKIIDEKQTVWLCDCNRPRMEKVLISLGVSELKSIIDEQGKIEIVCQFCNKKYTFSAEDVKRLVGEL